MDACSSGIAWDECFSNLLVLFFWAVLIDDATDSYLRQLQWYIYYALVVVALLSI